MARPRKKNKKEIELTQEETTEINNFKIYIDKTYAQLGNVRKQFLIQEKKALEAIEDAESEFMSYMKKIAKNKKIPNDEEWSFDLSTNKFIKQE